MAVVVNQRLTRGSAGNCFVIKQIVWFRRLCTLGGIVGTLCVLDRIVVERWRGSQDGHWRKGRRHGYRSGNRRERRGRRGLG
jgi:hypothetical protein